MTDILRMLREQRGDNRDIVATCLERSERDERRAVRVRVLDGHASAIQQEGLIEHQNPATSWSLTETSILAPPALTRWADAVSAGTAAPYDPKSISLWARAIGMSDGSLRALCGIAHLRAKASCTLVRVIRAVHLARTSGRMDPSEWLDVADARTLRRVLRAGGLVEGAYSSVSAVLGRQQLIANDAALILLCRALRRRRLLDDIPSSR